MTSPTDNALPDRHPDLRQRVRAGQPGPARHEQTAKDDEQDEGQLERHHRVGG